MHLNVDFLPENNHKSNGHRVNCAESAPLILPMKNEGIECLTSGEKLGDVQVQGREEEKVESKIEENKELVTCKENFIDKQENTLLVKGSRVVMLRFENKFYDCHLIELK